MERVYINIRFDIDIWLLQNYARAAVLNHCAAYELQPIDMVTLDFMNTQLIEEDAQESVDMGFLGKQGNDWLWRIYYL